MEKKRIRLWNYLVFPKPGEWSTSVWHFKCRVPDDEAISRGPTIVQLQRSLQQNRKHGSEEPWKNN
jgi:hypothetical protein